MTPPTADKTMIRVRLLFHENKTAGGVDASGRFLRRLSI
jgi:hypothetical protein